MAAVNGGALGAEGVSGLVCAEAASGVDALTSNGDSTSAAAANAVARIRIKSSSFD